MFGTLPSIYVTLLNIIFRERKGIRVKAHNTALSGFLRQINRQSWRFPDVLIQCQQVIAHILFAFP